MTYLYDGDQRISTPGLTTDNPDNPEAKTFKQIAGAHKSKDWTLLSSLCDTQIKEAPQWLTTYLYKAEVPANSGRIDDSIKLLDHVLKQARAIEKNHSKRLAHTKSMAIWVRLVMVGFPTRRPVWLLAISLPPARCCKS